MNDHIKEYLLDHYFKLENPQYAVMLKGKWGCGKTYFINKLIEELEISEKNESTEDEILLKPIYISLNGINTLKEITDLISAKLRPFINSKFVKNSLKVFKDIIKSTIKIDLDFDGDDKKDGHVQLNLDPKAFFSSKDLKTKGERILIFDDIERCKVPIDELFGYINHFVEHSKCSVILIAEEDKIEKTYNSDKNNSTNKIEYKDFKEKLVGQTFIVKSNPEIVVTSFFNSSATFSTLNNTNQLKKIAIDFFIGTNSENLRVLKQALLDFERFVSFMDDKYKSEKEYNVFLTNLLAYFIIVSCELKAGNTDVKKYQKFVEILPLTGDYDKLDEKENKLKTLQEQFDKKYDSLLTKYSIEHSDNVLNTDIIISFLENGFVEQTTFNDELSNNKFFKKNNIEAWEGLWSWHYLEDDKFVKLKELLWFKIKEKSVKNVFELLQLTGIFLDLKENNLFEEVSKEELVKTIKECADEIFKQTRIKYKKTLVKTMAINGKHFHSHKTESFIEVLKYIDEKNNKLYIKEYKQFVKTHLQNINNSNINDLAQNMLTNNPAGTAFYHDTAIFNYIDPIKLGENLLQLSNEGILTFNSYVGARYNLDAPNKKDLIKKEIHLLEIQNLEKLRATLAKSIPSKEEKPIKHINIKATIERLDIIIEVLKEVEAESKTKQ